jgi:GT2 family glycosyltransferase
LERQHYKDCEIIVIDQASIDGTREYLESVRERFDLHLICRDTKGTWAANNELGISMARGGWIAVSNPDIVFLPDSLGKLAIWTGSIDEDNFLGCHLLSPNGSDVYPLGKLTLANIFHVASHRTLGTFLDRKLWRRYFERHFIRKTDDLGDGCYAVDNINASFFMIHRKAIEKLGGLWGREFRWAVADSDLFERGRRNGMRQIYNHGIRLIHEGEHSRRTSPKPEYEYEYAYGYTCYARGWGHVQRLRLLFALDAILAPLLLSLAGQDSIRNQIKCSAARIGGLLG